MPKQKQKPKSKTKTKPRKREGGAVWLWPESLKDIETLVKRDPDPHATAARVLHPILKKAAGRK